MWLNFTRINVSRTAVVLMSFVCLSGPHTLFPCSHPIPVLRRVVGHGILVGPVMLAIASRSARSAPPLFEPGMGVGV